MRRRNTKRWVTRCLMIGGIGLLLFAIWVHRYIVREGFAGHTGRHAFAGVAAGRCVSLCYAYSGQASRWAYIDNNERTEDGNRLTPRLRIGTTSGEPNFYHGVYPWRYPMEHVVSRTGGFSWYPIDYPRTGARVYILQIPSWFFAALGLVMLLWSWRRWHAARHRLDVFCDTCGYDLRGSAESERCPECGTEIDPAMRERITGASREH